MVASIRASTGSVLTRRPSERAKGPHLEGVDRVEGEAGLQERLLKVSVDGAGGLIRDPVDSGADPGDQLAEASPVVREPGCPSRGCGEGVEPVLGDVDPDGAEDAVHGFFPFPVLVVRASMLEYPFRTEEETVATRTPSRPLTAMRPSDPTTAPAERPGDERSEPEPTLNSPGFPAIPTRKSSRKTTG